MVILNRTVDYAQAVASFTNTIHMNLGIEGKRALITGATGGIGMATARQLQEEGAELILSDLDASKLRDSAGELMGKGKVTLIAADVTSDADLKALAQKAGKVDILVHTTGVTGAKGDPLSEVTDEDYREAYEVDFLSGVRVARLFAPGMLESGWGRIVFITSENVAQPYSDEAAYNAAKAALLAFSKSLAQLYAPKGVLVNCVAPAFIETKMTDGMMDKRADKMGCSKQEAIDSFLKEERPHLVLKRRGKPEEVASVIAFLCSERASFVVGSNYRVDGGSVLSLDL